MRNDNPNPPPRDVPEVPFVSDWADHRPFSDLGPGAGGIDWLDRMLKGWEKTRELTEEGGGFEAEVGGWNTVPAGLLELLARQRRAVARIVVRAGLRDYRGVVSDRGWTGTGFLVAPNLLLTNHHVLNSPEAAAEGVAEFEYEWPVDKLFADVVTVNPPSVQFRLEPARLFVTSPADLGLDFTFVWISEQAASRFGSIEMERGSFMINQSEPSFVIHHPRGRLKEISLDDTEVLGVNATSLLYAADTDYGSSGACVFNKNGRLVALHHARRAGADMAARYPQMQQQLLDGRAVTVANEGIKISAIALDLENRARAGKSDSESAAEILRHVRGSDTLTGMFGGLGRQAAERGNDRERVLDLYRGGEQDLDIGFWNLRWLLDVSSDQGRLDAIAAAMMDIKLDVWCLSEVPVNVLTQLVDLISRKFGIALQILHAEPVSAGQVLTTAVLWRAESHTCVGAEWPAMMRDVWTRSVPLADGQGGMRPLFRTPPPLFRLGIAGTEGRAIACLVPFDLREIGQNARLRRLVSKLTVHAIGLASSGPDAEVDWIVGGDLQPPIAREDLIAHRVQGFEMAGVRDEAKGGAISYLHAPRSAVGKVFLSGDLTPVESDAQFIEVVKGRTVDRFFAALSDTRPVVMRLALQARSSAMSEDDLSQVFNSLVGDLPTPSPAADDRRGTASVSTAAPLVPADVDQVGWPGDLKSENLTKQRFLQLNRPVLRVLAEMVNTRLRAQYPAGISPLSEADLWVVIFAEAGLKNGLINPDALHSNGERGLLPLPNNITFWNGPGVPDWRQPMPLAVNLEHYATYLGQLKNKPVKEIGGRMFYRDLFRMQGLHDNASRQARLLAGVIHGYFVSQNYGGRAVPTDRILAGYAADRPIPQILAGTGYVHTGTGILEGRQRNIDDALALLAAS